MFKQITEEDLKRQQENREKYLESQRREIAYYLTLPNKASWEEIIKADFKINPKIYDKENISCSFCTFKDLCYVKEKDYIYLDKVEDLSFLGGEEE